MGPGRERLIPNRIKAMILVVAATAGASSIQCDNLLFPLPGSKPESTQTKPRYFSLPSPKNSPSIPTKTPSSLQTAIR